jgi:hypothetical protein
MEINLKFTLKGGLPKGKASYLLENNDDDDVVETEDSIP